MGPRQPVSVAGIEFDALIESNEKYSASVPAYPVDKGYSVSDHAALEPLELSMTLYVTATPVTWLNRHGVGENRIDSICGAMKQIFFARQPITITTQDGSYSNMVAKMIEIKNTPEEGYAREIPVVFVQVAVTSTSAVSVPDEYVRAGKSMESTGSASKSGGKGSGGGSGDGSGGGGDGFDAAEFIKEEAGKLYNGARNLLDDESLLYKGSEFLGGLL